MIFPRIAIGCCCSIAMLCCYFSVLANGCYGLFFNSVKLSEILMGNMLKSLWSPELCKAPWQCCCSKYTKTQHTPECFLFTAQKTGAPEPLGLLVWGKSSSFLMWTGYIWFLLLSGISDFLVDRNRKGFDASKRCMIIFYKAMIYYFIAQFHFLYLMYIKSYCGTECIPNVYKIRTIIPSRVLVLINELCRLCSGSLQHCWTPWWNYSLIHLQLGAYDSFYVI